MFQPQTSRVSSENFSSRFLFLSVYAKRAGPERPGDLANIDSCAYIWEAGVGFATSPPHVPVQDYHRTELLKLLLTCFSEAMYLPPSGKRVGSFTRGNIS